nr:hypothetical protein [Pseudomonas sp. efr-133-TYG-103a]
MDSFSGASNQCHLVRSVLGELWQYWISQRGQAGESQEKQRCSHQNLHHGKCFFPRASAEKQWVQRFNGLHIFWRIQSSLKSGELGSVSLIGTRGLLDGGYLTVALYHLTNHEFHQFFNEARIEIGFLSQTGKPFVLTAFTSLINRRQLMFCLEHSNLVSATKALGEHMDQCGVNIVDGLSECRKLGADVWCVHEMSSLKLYFLKSLHGPHLVLVNRSIFVTEL